MRSSKIFLLATFYSQIFVLNTLLNPISTFFILPKIKSQAKDVYLSWLKSFEFINRERSKIFIWTNQSIFGPSGQRKRYLLYKDDLNIKNINKILLYDYIRKNGNDRVKFCTFLKNIYSNWSYKRISPLLTY